MKLVLKLAIPQVFIVAIIGLFGFVTINSSFVSIREQYVQDVVRKQFQFINNAVQSAAEKTVSEASFFVTLPVVIQAYEVALTGNIDDPFSPQSRQAVQMLRRDLGPLLDNYYRRTGTRLLLHFHLPNSLSLVRLWRETQDGVEGDWLDVTNEYISFRPMAMEVNATGIPAMGIEPGSTGFSVQGIVPVVAPSGRHLGSIKVLQDFEPILDMAAEGDDVYVALYANDELLDFSAELRNAERFPPKGDFVRIVGSHNGVVESMLTEELLTRGRYGTYYDYYSSIVLSTLPLDDHQGNQVGVIVMAKDISTISRVVTIASSVLAAMLAIIAVAPIFANLVQMRLLVARPLNKMKATIQDITEDKADLNDKVPSRQSDEIGDLAKSFNTFTDKLDHILQERQEMVNKIQLIREQTEAELTASLSQERDIVQTMKDNIEQGIFLMDKDFKILPQYSKPLISILSYYDSELEGKNFLDILAASLDGKQLQTMKGYFSMIFEKSKRASVLEAANPIAEFEYKIDDRHKILSTKFNLIEKPGSDLMIIGIIQDITKDKEFEMELQAQKEAKEQELKNMLDVIQIDPMVFHDFVDDTESNFSYINATLKNRSLTERQIVTKIFQSVHAIKSNALILGLEAFGTHLHTLEEDIKKISNKREIAIEDILDLTLKLETIMQEQDSYINIINKIESYKTTHQTESILVSTLKTAVETIAEETGKNVHLVAEYVDMDILGTKLRKPIKDILLQCAKNSVYHSIETPNERSKKKKNPRGQLTLSVKMVDDKAVVSFADDGKGLDWQKIKAKYLKMYPEAKSISNKVLLSAIFSPEFSTAGETTTVAGRGVGLSLVRDIVKENGGTIAVNSSDDGAVFKFTFPMPASA